MIRKTLVINQPEVCKFMGERRIFAGFLTITFAIAAALCNHQDAIAQTPNPQTLLPGRLEDIPETPLPSDVLPKPPDKNQLLPSPQLPNQPTLEQSDSNAKFRVDRIDVVGSTVFKAEEFAAVTDPFLGRELTFAELLQVKDAITKLYTDQGYVTTGALVTPQTVEAGVIKVQVIEGSVQEIKIIGNRRLHSKYIRDRIELGTGKPLNIPHLLEKLQVLRLNPRIQNLSAELQTGVRPGTNLLRVEVEEADTFKLTASLDNGRSPSVGSFRRGVDLQEANLLGFGDTLSVGYANTDGSNTINVNYALPINAHDGTVSFGFSQGWNRVIEKPFSVLDIQSNSRSYELGYRQPLLQKPTQDLAVGLSFSRQESQTELGLDSIGPFQLSPGADANGKTNISALRFFQEYTQRSNQYVFAARSQLSFGLDWFDANVSDNEPDSRFFAWRGQAQWVRQLAPDTLFLARCDFQLATDSLVPLEQFGLGGQLSVRGYRQDALLTDNGLLFSAEFRVPIVRAAKIGGVLQLTLGKGNGGTMNIYANTASFDGFGATGVATFASSAVNETADGNGGAININANSLSVTNGALLTTITVKPGSAGDINVNANTLEVLNGGQILSTSFGSGRAGTLTFNVSDRITLSGSDPTYSERSKLPDFNDAFNTGAASGLFANTVQGATGAGGDLRIRTGQLLIQDGASVSVSNQGTGSAGNLLVTADSIRLKNAASLSAESRAGSQGNIILDADNIILRQGSNITTDATGLATGGNITIKSPIILGLENSDISANAVQGQGGKIQITTQGIFGLKYRDRLTPENDITASSEFGVNGTVQVNNVGVDPNSGLVELPVNLVDSSQQIATGCSANQGSSFVATGRGGVPQNPNQQVMSDVYDGLRLHTWSDIRNLTAYRKNSSITAQMTTSSETLVQATSWRRNAQGKIEIVAEKSVANIKQPLSCAAIPKS
jgi:hemolysin activation/secretion protein